MASRGSTAATVWPSICSAETCNAPAAVPMLKAAAVAERYSKAVALMFTGALYCGLVLFLFIGIFEIESYSFHNCLLFGGYDWEK